MGPDCAPLIDDLLLFFYERDFMASLPYNKRLDLFKYLTLHLNDLLNIDNPFLEGMVGKVYPPELQLNKANASDIEAPFF